MGLGIRIENPFGGGNLVDIKGPDYLAQLRQEREERAARERAEQSRANLAGLQSTAQNIADQFRANLPSYQRGLLDQARFTSRKALAQRIQGQTEDLNRRGLVSGGIAQGQAAKATSESSADLASKESEIADQAYQQMEDFDDFTANLGMQLSGMDIDKQNEYFRNALENRMRRNEAFGQLGGAAGNIAGNWLASQQNKQGAA